MQEHMVKKLVRIKTLLLAAICLLSMAEFSLLLYQVFDFLWAVIGALVVLAIRIAFYFYQDDNGWQQRLLLCVAILGVIAPVIYYFYKNGFSSVFLVLYFAVGFLSPIGIMLYINKILTQLIAHPDG